MFQGKIWEKKEKILSLKKIQSRLTRSHTVDADSMAANPPRLGCKPTELEMFQREFEFFYFFIFFCFWNFILKHFKFGRFAVKPLVLTTWLWALQNLKRKFYFK
jgi:hypothetical protein